jgi:hypothetical protein
MHGIKDSTHGYQNYNTSQILMFGGYVKVKESLYTRVNIWVGTILKYIDTIVQLYLSKKVLAWCINLNYIKNKDAVKYLKPTVIKKFHILIIDTRIIFNKQDTNSPLI